MEQQREEVICEYYVRNKNGEVVREYGPISPDLLVDAKCSYDLPVHKGML